MRKKLLSEAQVRRFQSLASIKPLNEMGSYGRDDDEKMEETYGDKAHLKDDLDEEKHDDDEKMEALYEEEEDDMEDMDEADVSIDEDLVEKFMEAAETIQEIADALGGEAGDMDDEPGDDMDLDAAEPADDMDAAADAGDAGDKPEPSPLEEEEMLQEALRGIQYVPSQKEIVSTVAKRVAKRLQEAKRAEARLNRALGKRR